MNKSVNNIDSERFAAISRSFERYDKFRADDQHRIQIQRL